VYAAKTKQSTIALFLRALVPVVILAAGFGGFWAISHGLSKAPPLADEHRELPTAHVAAVREHAEGITIDGDGLVVPFREIDISAEVPGRIIERAEICRAGNFVRRGQKLVTIDPRDYQLEVDRLTQQLQQATIALDEWSEEIRGVDRLLKIAQQNLDLRARELARLKAAERTAFSLSDLERAEGAKLEAENTLETLRNRKMLLEVSKARLESARDLASSQLEKAQLDLERTEITAPTDGVIINDLVEQDMYVQGGTPLLTIEDTSKVEVKCKLEMEDLYWLWDRAESAQQSAESRPSEPSVADAYGIPAVPVQVVYTLSGHGDWEYEWQGKLQRYDGLGLDETTRTVACRVVVDQPRRRQPTGRSGPPALVRGMYVTVRIKVKPRTRLLEIPEKGLRPGNKVWRVRDGKLRIVPVNFVTLRDPLESPIDEQRSAVIYLDSTGSHADHETLVPGDQVVVSPLVFVRSGMDIQVTSDDAQATQDGETASR